MIDPHRFQQAREIFTAALTRPESAREAFVLEACGDDGTLLDDVRNLVACHIEGVDPVDSATSWDTPPAIPTRIGPYHVLELIGQGGMGIVYRARIDDADSAASPARIVAVKVLRPGIVTSQVERRFRREIEVLRRLEHAGIARLLDAGAERNEPYLVTEFVEGRNLSQWRTETGPPLNDRLRVLASLADAVHYAHSRGVIHRDLKPENILVTPAGAPKVLDFGVARLTTQDAPIATLATQTWQLLGTVRYMSPEQVTGGPATLDARSDVYSLGVIAYELLTGNLPYDLNRMSTPRALLEVANAEPNRLEGHGEVLARIVDHALEKDPGRRYQTAGDLADDLRCVLVGKAIGVRRPGPTAPIRRWLRTHGRLRRVLAIVMVAVVATGGTIAATSLWRPSTAPTWAGLYTGLEEGDQLRHSGPQTRENYLIAAGFFQRARNDLTALPARPYSADLNRYAKWRLGELHFFIGQQDHDADQLEMARGYWHDAASVPWVPGSALGIDSQAIVRTKVLRLGKHHPHAAMGFALGALAQLKEPATNWRAASLTHEVASFFCAMGRSNYQDDSVFPATRREDLAYTLLNLGGAETALGATVDSLSVVNRGLQHLRDAVARQGIEGADGLSMEAEALGTAHLRRAELLDRGAAVAALDSAALYLQRAGGQRGLDDPRGYWRLHRQLANVWEVRARLLAERDGVIRALQQAAAELREALRPLRSDLDGLERGLATADLAAVTAQLAAMRSR